MTKESERVNSHRKKFFDQVPFLIEKGGRALLRVLALRRGTNIAEYLRTSALHEAGLNAIPFPDDLALLEEISTQEEATAAVFKLQAAEKHGAIRKVVTEGSAEADNKVFEMTITRGELTDLRAAAFRIKLAANKDDYDALKVRITGKELRTVRRILGNLEEIRPQGDG